MTGKLKVLILLVALLALPLRGMAAVAMWHCAQDQRDAMSVSLDEHAEHQGVHADGSGHASTPHEAPDGHPTTHAASVCSACAACCAGAAVVPAALISFSSAPIGASRIPYVEQRFTGVVPARFDRPPRVLPL